MNYNSFTNNSVVQSLLETYNEIEQQKIKHFISEANKLIISSDNDILEKAIIDIYKQQYNNNDLNGSLQENRNDYNAYVYLSLDDSKFINESISFNDVETVDLQTVISNIKNKYHIFRDNDWLFRIRNFNNIETLAVSKNLSLRTDSLVISIPNIENNVEIINKEMLKFGYYNAVQKCLTVGTTEYYYVLYNPIKEKTIDELLRSKLRMKHFVYHLTPLYNLDSIKKQGILAKTNSKYSGKRLFCYPNGEYYNDNSFIEMMISIMKNDSKFDNKLIALCIDLDKIQDVEFYLDANAENCIYCKEDISVEAINWRRSELLEFEINGDNYSMNIKDLEI